MKVTAENISRIAKNLFGTNLDSAAAESLTGAISKGFDESTGSFSSKRLIPEKVPIGYNGKTIEGFNSFDELQAKRKEVTSLPIFAGMKEDEVLETLNRGTQNLKKQRSEGTISAEDFKNRYKREFDFEVYPSNKELSNIDQSKIMYEEQGDNALSALIGKSGKTEAEAAEALDFLFDKSAGKEFSNEALSNLKTAQARTGEYGLGMMSLPTKGNGLDLLGSNEMTAAIGGGVIGGAVNSAFGGDFESGFMAGGLAGGLGKSLHKHIAGSADDLLRMEKNAIGKVLDPEKSYDDLLKEKKAVYQSEEEGINKQLNEAQESLKSNQDEIKKVMGGKEEYYESKHGYFEGTQKKLERQKANYEKNYTKEQRDQIDRVINKDESHLEDIAKDYGLERDQVKKVLSKNGNKEGDADFDQFKEMTPEELKLYENLNNFQPKNKLDYAEKRSKHTYETDMEFNARYSNFERRTDSNNKVLANNLQANEVRAQEEAMKHISKVSNGPTNISEVMETINKQRINNIETLDKQYLAAQEELEFKHFPTMNKDFTKAVNEKIALPLKLDSNAAQLEKHNSAKSLLGEQANINKNMESLNAKNADLNTKMKDENLHKELLKEASTKELGDSAGFMQKRSQNLIKPGNRKEQKSLGIDSRHMVLGGAALAGGIFGSRKRDHSRGFNSHRGSRI